MNETVDLLRNYYIARVSAFSGLLHTLSQLPSNTSDDSRHDFGVVHADMLSGEFLEQFSTIHLDFPQDRMFAQVSTVLAVHYDVLTKETMYSFVQQFKNTDLFIALDESLIDTSGYTDTLQVLLYAEMVNYITKITVTPLKSALTLFKEIDEDFDANMFDEIYSKILAMNAVKAGIGYE